MAAVAASMLAAQRAWPAQYAASRESLAAAELLAAPCLVFLLRRTLPTLQPAALCWAALQYLCLARRVRLRAWAALLLPLALLVALASGVDCCKLHSAAPADLLATGAQVRWVLLLLTCVCTAEHFLITNCRAGAGGVCAAHAASVPIGAAGAGAACKHWQEVGCICGELIISMGEG
jgi:hypothetical protein